MKTLTKDSAPRSAAELDALLGSNGDLFGKAREAGLISKATITPDATGATGLSSTDRLFRENLLAPALLLQDAVAPMYRELPKPVEQGCDLSWKIIDNMKPSGRATISKDDCGIGVTTTHDSKTVLTSMTAVRNNGSVSDCNVRISSNYDDLVSLGKMMDSQRHMEIVEDLIWGGQIAALAAPTTFTPDPPVFIGSGGAISAGKTYEYQVTSLTMEGFRESQCVGYNLVGYAGARNGESVVSPTSTITAASAANDSIDITWDDVAGAVAYNVYVQEGGAGGFTFLGTAQSTTFTQTADEVATNLAPPGADTSADPNAFAGILSYLIQFGAPFVDQSNAALTFAGNKSVEQFNTQFQSIYATDKTGPNEIWMAPGVAFSVFNGLSGQAAPQITMPMQSGSGFTGGFWANGVMNPMTGEMVRFRVHPNFPSGLVIGLRRTAPFEGSRLAGASIDLPGVAHISPVDLARTDACIRWYLESCLTLRFKSTLGSFVLKNVGV